MLSDFTLAGFRFVIKGGQRLRVTVFDWDDNAGKIIITESNRTWVTVVLTLLYLLGQAAFEIRQLFNLARDPKEPFEDYMKLIIQFATRLMAILMQIESMAYGESAVEFVNQILRLNNKIKGRVHIFLVSTVVTDCLYNNMLC